MVGFALAGIAGLLLGLLLLSAAGSPERSQQLVHRVSAPGAPARDLGVAAGSEEGGFDLELPGGERRRVPTEALPALLALKEELDRAPTDARLDLDQRAIIAEQPGRRLDVDASLLAIHEALLAGGTRAPLVFESIAPHRHASELRDVEHDVVLGAFETTYDRGRSGREPDLQRLARALDGRVLLPGESFTFNSLVGPRDETHGYALAAALERGDRVDGIGSSASQSASTLYAAATFAALEVLDRHPWPGPRPVIELGLEAAVAFPTLDLRLRNPYDFPVVLREVVSDGRLRVEVRGRRRPYVITLIRKVERATPFAQLERADASLPVGERVLAQRGVPGLELRWHHIRSEGSHSVRRTSIERYASTPQIVVVGTGQSTRPATGRPQHVPGPEYLPNELLVMTQGDARDGSITVQRVPGRYGTPGWTQSIGAPAWRGAPETVGEPLSATHSAEFF